MPDTESILTFPLIATPAAATVYGEVVVPYNCDVTDIIAVVTTAPAVSPLNFDIIKNPNGANTSIFAAPLAAVAVKSPVGTADTVIYAEFVGNVAPDLQAGAFLLIDSEIVQLTPQVISGSGLVTGGEQGSSKVDGGQPVFALNVTRAAEGTTPATHLAGASIYPAKPQIAIGAFESSLASNPAWTSNQVTGLVEGDVLQLKTLAGSFTTAANLEVSIEIDQR